MGKQKENSGAEIERKSRKRKVKSEGQEENIEKIDWWRRGGQT